MVTLFMANVMILFSVKDWNYWIEYNVVLVITGTIWGTLKEKLYNELGLESLQSRWWYRKLSFLYKVSADQSPYHLFNIIPRKKIHLAQLESQIAFLCKSLNTIFSKTASFGQLLRNGIDLTLTFGNHIGLVYSKNVS